MSDNQPTVEQLQARIAELEAQNALLELQVTVLIAKINELVPYVDYSRMRGYTRDVAGTGMKTGEWLSWMRGQSGAK